MPIAKNYSAYIFEETLGRLDFRKYHSFENINGAYSNFIQKFMEVIELVAPIMPRWIKKTHKNGLTVTLQKKLKTI